MAVFAWVVYQQAINITQYLYYTEWTILDDYFSLLCNCLPDDYQSTLIKLKSLPHLSNDDHRQLDSMISSSHEVQLVNEKIVTFLIVKLCYNGSSSDLVGLCDVMDNLIVSKQSASCVQQVRYGEIIIMYMYYDTIGTEM